MEGRTQRILDSMITAVDEGFSYDGIVSAPETGLEDAEYRSGPLTARSLVLDGVDRVQTTAATVSRGTVRALTRRCNVNYNLHRVVDGTPVIKEKTHTNAKSSISSREGVKADRQNLNSDRHQQAIDWQPYDRIPLLADEIEVDLAYAGCGIQSLAPCNIVSLDIVRVKSLCARHLGWRPGGLRDKTAREWEIVTPVDANQEEPLWKTDTEEWEVLPVSVRLSDETVVGSPGPLPVAVTPEVEDIVVPANVNQEGSPEGNLKEPEEPKPGENDQLEIPETFDGGERP